MDPLTVVAIVSRNWDISAADPVTMTCPAIWLASPSSLPPIDPASEPGDPPGCPGRSVGGTWTGGDVPLKAVARAARRAVWAWASGDVLSWWL